MMQNLVVEKISPELAREENPFIRGFFFVDKRGYDNVVTGWCVTADDAKNFVLPEALEIFAGERYLGTCVPDQERPDVAAVLGGSCPSTCGFLARLPEDVDPDDISVQAMRENWRGPLAPQFENHGAKKFLASIPKDMMPHLMPSRLNYITFGLTEACNLRCVYCTTRAMEKLGTHTVDPDIVMQWDDGFINKIADLTDEVYFCGNGEPTLRKDWQRIVENLEEKGVRVSLTSNLSRDYTQGEIECLASLKKLFVSLDTTDAEIHGQLRRNSRLEKILENIGRIKKASAKRESPVQIIISSVISNRTYKTIPEMAKLCVNLDAHGAILISLATSSPLKEIGIDLYGLSAFSDKELQETKKNLGEFAAIMRHHHKKYILFPDLRLLEECPSIQEFKKEFDDFYNMGSSSTSKVEKGFTRNCLAPWNALNFFQGKVSPCCVITGNVPYDNETEIGDIVNRPEMIKIRHGLYTGNLVTTCERCNLIDVIPVEEFQQKVKNWHQTNKFSWLFEI